MADQQPTAEPTETTSVTGDVNSADSVSIDAPASLEVEALPEAQAESSQSEPSANHPVTMEEAPAAPSGDSLSLVGENLEVGGPAAARAEPASLDVAQESVSGHEKEGAASSAAHSIAMEETTSMISAEFALPGDGPRDTENVSGTAAIAEVEGEEEEDSHKHTFDQDQQSLSLGGDLQDEAPPHSTDQHGAHQQEEQQQGPPTISTTEIAEEDSTARREPAEASVAMQETGSIASGLFGSTTDEVAPASTLHPPEPRATEDVASLQSMDSEQAAAATAAATAASIASPPGPSTHTAAGALAASTPGPVHGAGSADVSVFADGPRELPDTSIVDVTLSDSTLLSPAARAHASHAAHAEASSDGLASASLAPAASDGGNVSVVDVTVSAPEEEPLSRSRSKTLSQGDWGDAALPVGPPVSDESRPRSKTASNLAQLAGLAPASALPAAGSPTAPPPPATAAAAGTAESGLASPPAAVTAEEEQARQLVAGAAAGLGGAPRDLPLLDDHSATPSPALAPSGPSASELDPDARASAISRASSRLVAPRGLGEEDVVNVDLDSHHEGVTSPDVSAATHTRLAHMVEPLDEFEVFESAAPEERAAIEAMHAAWPCAPAALRKTANAPVAGPGASAESVESTLEHPRVLHVTPEDRLAELAARHGIDASRRAARHQQDAAGDVTSLRACIQRRAWRAVLAITTKYLSSIGHGLTSGALAPIDGAFAASTPKYSAKTLQVWFCRMCAFVKMRMYKEAAEELATFGSLDRADLFFEHSPEAHPDRRGSMVPFSLRVLHAELPYLQQQPLDALERLHRLLHTVQRVRAHLAAGRSEYGDALPAKPQLQARQALWQHRELRLLHTIAGVYLALKNYSLAYTTMRDVLVRSPGNLHVLSAMGRILLQAGDIVAADEHFAQVDAAAAAKQAPADLLEINHGFMAMARNAYETASKHFQAAAQLAPQRPGPACDAGVCMLYRGSLKDAIAYYETVLRDGPVADVMLLNLCSLYEIESNSSTSKKKAILEMIIDRVDDEFNHESLKLDLKTS
eukprot:m.86132 g.86132  ORF g.86132 m.86132 type:complete len:1038 (-) comp13537_c0_seq1:21-3134(-)